MESEVLWQESSSNNRPEIFYTLSQCFPKHTHFSCRLLHKVLYINDPAYLLWAYGRGLVPFWSYSCWLGPMRMTDDSEWSSELYGSDLELKNRVYSAGEKTTNQYSTIQFKENQAILHNLQSAYPSHQLWYTAFYSIWTCQLIFYLSFTYLSILKQLVKLRPITYTHSSYKGDIALLNTILVCHLKHEWINYLVHVHLLHWHSHYCLLEYCYDKLPAPCQSNLQTNKTGEKQLWGFINNLSFRYEHEHECIELERSATDARHCLSWK